MIRRALLLMIAFACVAVQYVVPASAHHHWKGFHWPRTKNPVVVKIGDNVDASWKSYLATAAADWSKSSVVDTTILAGNGCERPTIGRVEICTKRYAAGWMGATSVETSGGGHLVDAVIRLNNKYLPGYEAREAPAGDLPRARTRVGAGTPGRAFRQPEPRLVHGLHEQADGAAEQRAPEPG